MKFYQFKDNINYESTEKLLSFLGENTKEDIIIYLSSGGGSIGNSKSLRNAIEKHGKVTLIASIAIASAAFSLFFSTKCKKEILPLTRGMWHFGSWEISMNYKGKGVSYEDEFIRTDIKKQDKEQTLEICKLVGMDTKDIDKIMKYDKDVWFNTKQLKQFLKNTLRGNSTDVDACDSKGARRCGAAQNT